MKTNAILWICIILSISQLNIVFARNPVMYPIEVGESFIYQLVELNGTMIIDEGLVENSTRTLTLKSYGKSLQIPSNLDQSSDVKPFVDEIHKSNSWMTFDVKGSYFDYLPPNTDIIHVSSPYNWGSTLIVVNWEYWRHFDKIIQHFQTYNQSYSYSFFEDLTTFTMIQEIHKNNDFDETTTYVSSYDKQEGILLSSRSLYTGTFLTTNNQTRRYTYTQVNNLTKHQDVSFEFNIPKLSFSEISTYLGIFISIIWIGRYFRKDQLLDRLINL